MRGPDARALILTAGMPVYSPGGLVKNISELPLKSLEMLQVLRNVHNRLLTFPTLTILEEEGMSAMMFHKLGTNCGKAAGVVWKNLP